MADKRFDLDPKVLLTANSAATLSTSSSETQRMLVQAINNLSEDMPDITIASSTGHYITPVGEARVVWTRERDKILITTIFAPST